MKKAVQIIAAIDIGSNSIHMLLGYMNSEGELITIKSYKKIISLGSSLAHTGELSKVALENTCLALEKMRDRAQAYRPVFMVVGTYAVRAAKNRADLLENIYKRTRLRVKVLPGDEEARLMGLAISYNFSRRNKELLCLDIGGGSTEIAVYKNHRPLYLKSLALGSVVLTSKFLKNKGQTLSYAHIEKLEKTIEKTLAPLINKLKDKSFKKAVICSGLGKTLAFMDYVDKTGEKLQNPDRYHLTRKKLQQFRHKVCRLKHPSKIKAHWKISGNRSEIVLAGLLVLYLITEKLKISSWTISNYGIREGLILDTQKLEKKRPRPHAHPYKKT